MSWKCKECGAENVDTVSKCVVCRNESGEKSVKAEKTKESKGGRFNPKWYIIAFLALYVFVNRGAFVSEGEEELTYESIMPAPATRTVMESQKWEYKRMAVGAGDRKLDSSGAISFWKREYLSRVYGSEPKEASMVVFTTDDESKLKKLGEEGWELVTSFLEMETAFYNMGNSDYHTGIKPNVRPQRVVLIFKRPKIGKLSRW